MTPTQLEQLLAAFERLTAALAPYSPTIGIVLVALLGRGIKETANRIHATNAEPPSPEVASAVRDSGSFVHYIATQERRIGELEAQLTHEQRGSADMLACNLRLQAENDSLRAEMQALSMKMIQLESAVALLRGRLDV
jgi:uncharacterized protein YceH (UPF0502 family)